MPTHAEFEQSYEQSSRYPKNLFASKNFSGPFHRYHAMLDAESQDLLIADDSKTRVRFHDIMPKTSWPLSDLSTPEIVSQAGELKTDEAVHRWLSGQGATDSETGGGEMQPLNSPDPTYRFINLYAPTSRSELKLTRKALSQILTYHQVMPEFLNALCLIGRSDGPRNPTHHFFHTKTLLKPSSLDTAVERLGRSGRMLQISYTLRDTCLGGGPEGLGGWTIRPAAFCHHFDVVHGKTLWLNACGHWKVQKKIKLYLGNMYQSLAGSLESPAKSFCVSLNMHLLHAEWALEGWRAHGNWLDEEIKAKTEKAVQFKVVGSLSVSWNPNCLPEVQHLEEKISMAIAALDSNAQVLSSLRDYYLSLLANRHFELAVDCREDVEEFAEQLGNVVLAFEVQKTKVKHQFEICRQRKELVSEVIQSQATGKVETLAHHSRQISLWSQREAAFMRIIAVLTLIYLPATFTSTFFSANIFEFNNSELGMVASWPALSTWLEMTAPFTVITILLAVWFYWKYDKEYQNHLARLDRKTFVPQQTGLPTVQRASTQTSCINLFRK